MSDTSNLYPVFEHQKVSRQDRENHLNQHSRIIWLCGLSGSGKSTLALALEKKLFDLGFHPYVLDGDNIRTGLNNNLGFTDDDRTENIRRIAEVARLFAHAGVIPITSFICPLESQRKLARKIIGNENFLEVYVDCPFEICEERDVKGLYAKARAGQVANFTGRSSAFEAPHSPDLHLKTHEETPDESLRKLVNFVLPHISLKKSD